MKFFTVLAVCFFSSIICANTLDTLNRKHSFFIGAGNYEYLHVGYNFSFKQRHYSEIALGIKPWGFKNSSYQMGYFCMGTRLFKKKIVTFSSYIHVKCLTWRYDNLYNRFVVLGINPEIRLHKLLKNSFALTINGGGFYNSPIYYKRKTYLEVGWPKEWQPSFSIQLVYLMK